MAKRLVLLVDGGYMRAQARKANPPRVFDAALVTALANRCVDPATEELHRVLYYDCPEYSGTVQLPISRAPHKFAGTDALLRDLAARDHFAVREGSLRFRGWDRKRVPGQAVPAAPPTDADFKPKFVQKGIDMRIGLDIATYAASDRIDRLGLVTADTDLVPALKHARRAGLQVTVYELPGQRLHRDLIEHADIRRVLAWP
ncbi:MAG: NYN domain-containing protein [Myxococcales bacterium]|nr:NYN domain-containing protein [Myxococcales bacterium]